MEDKKGGTPGFTPSFESVDKTGPLGKALKKAKKGGGEKSGGSSKVAVFALILSILLIFYAIYLNVQLSDANKRIKQLVLETQNTETRVDGVEEKIFDTENKLEKQIKLTDEKFARLHEKQMNEVEKIRKTVARKADRVEVASVKEKTKRIISEVGSVKNNLQNVGGHVKKVDTKVKEVASKVEQQQKELEEQRKLIERNFHNINATREQLNKTKNVLDKVKMSIDRDYYVFQLSKVSGIIRVADVGLRLKKIRLKDQKYDIEIFHDDKKMKRKKVEVGVPIFFYKSGYKKPYELVITKVEKHRVVGYLSVPKVKQ